MHIQRWKRDHRTHLLEISKMGKHRKKQKPEANLHKNNGDSSMTSQEPETKSGTKRWLKEMWKRWGIEL